MQSRRAGLRDAVSCPVDASTAAVAAREAPAGPFTRPEASVPAVKRTQRGLYLTAQDAYDMVSEAPAKVLFVDVRTRGELQSRLLAQLREIRALQINVESRFLTVATDWFVDV